MGEAESSGNGNEDQVLLPLHTRTEKTLYIRVLRSARTSFRTLGAIGVVQIVLGAFFIPLASVAGLEPLSLPSARIAGLLVANSLLDICFNVGLKREISLLSFQKLP